MNRPVFLTSSQISTGPVALAILRVMEHVSLRPKTVGLPVLALGGLGIFYSMQMLPPNDNKDNSRKKRKLVLWDFFDPQGHHEIEWN